ncbi:Triacylglycerol lipase [Aphelenchoides besseyi]|nr:Triacylglycerol lipase [Aphelenchoides besseyi]
MYNSTLRLFILISWLLIGCNEATNCTKFVDCKSCTHGGDILLPCVWCTHRHKCGNALEMAGSTEKTRITLPYDCPVPPAAKHLYTDYFARTRALPFIAAANSRNMKELLVEVVDFMLQTQNDFQPVGGSVISYFYHSFFALWNGGLENRLRSAIQQFPKSEVWCRSSIVLFTNTILLHKCRCDFHSPLSHSYTIDTRNDMEPKSKCTICLRAEDPNCSLGTSDPPDPLIHRNYFNVTLSEWPKSSCRLPADLYELYRGSKPWTRLLKGPV